MHVATRGSQLYLHGRLTQVPYGNGVLNTHMHAEILETANTLPKQQRGQDQFEQKSQRSSLYPSGEGICCSSVCWEGETVHLRL